MALTIATNIAALQLQDVLAKNQLALQRNFRELSTGYRISQASDDSSGVALSVSLQSQIRSFTWAERNATAAIGMTQVAEGALGQVTSVLHRMRELAMQGSNGSLTTTDRGLLQTEFTELRKEVNRVQNATRFNDKNLLTAATTVFQAQVGYTGANTYDRITVRFGGLTFSGLNAAALSGPTATQSKNTLSVIDSTLKQVLAHRAKYGAATNRLEVAVSHIRTMRVNVVEAQSRLQDADVADVTSEMARNQILSQAATALLAQANQAPMMAVNLIR